MADYYLWLRALHIISFISWMAGMLYLPRIFVYHTKVKPGSEASEMFKVMEKKLLRYIMNPAMIATVLFGILLIVETGIGAPGTGGWIHVKVVLVVVLVIMHGMLARRRRQFARDANTKSERYYRILNEIPALLMVGIVLLAVFKPF